MAIIHPTAIIESGAEIAPDVKIGPYCIIGNNVKLKTGVELKSHVVLEGYTEVGENTVIFPFASIGQPPQDLKYKGGKSEVIIGKNNTIREYVTIHPGTDEGGVTIIGDNCLLMIGAHIAHDCVVGNNVIFANNATLAGHVSVGDHVVMGGLSAVHQFVRIGEGAMIGGLSAVAEDVIPFATVKGERAFIAGANYIGLKRRGFAKQDLHLIMKVFDELFDVKLGLFDERIDMIKEKYQGTAIIDKILEFLEFDNSRAICSNSKKNSNV